MENKGHSEPIVGDEHHQTKETCEDMLSDLISLNQDLNTIKKQLHILGCSYSDK
ncbi:hypothetical protein SCREM1_10 [Synechococcus phage S-CREM1]|nr:hypothetical protein SCREM1_10 [Synechococcus phage S-CREM1]